MVTNTVSGTSNYRTLDELRPGSTRQYVLAGPPVAPGEHQQDQGDRPLVQPELHPEDERPEGDGDSGQPVADQAAAGVSAALTRLATRPSGPRVSTHRWSPESGRTSPGRRAATVARDAGPRPPDRRGAAPPAPMACRMPRGASSGETRVRPAASGPLCGPTAWRACGEEAARVVQDAGVGRGLRHAHRHVRVPGRARRGPEHGAHARRSGPAHRQQARLPARASRGAATS